LVLDISLSIVSCFGGYTPPFLSCVAVCYFQPSCVLVVYLLL